MKVLILTADSNGGYPVPASKGGAVAILVEHLVDGNNKKQLFDMQVLSFFDEKAYDMAKNYPNVSFMWVKIPGIIRLLDKFAFNFIRATKKEVKAASFKSPFSLLLYICHARKVIKKTDVDCIVLENNIPLAMSLKNTKYKGNWYYHLHNVPRIDGKSRDVMDKTKGFLCVSQYVAEQISSETSAIGRIPTNKIKILKNCVDTSLFRPLKSDVKTLELRKKYGFTENDKVLIFTGRLTEEKGADALLEALSLLPHNVKALIVGSYLHNADVKSEFQDKLYKLADTLSDRVVFTGYIQHDELPYYYSLADLAVLPSIWDEPAGLTNLEAMACGIPVITTNSGGIPEYVGNSIVLRQDGKLPYEIATCVQELLSDPAKMDYLQKYSKSYVNDKFNKDDYIVRFNNCILENSYND